MIRSMKAVLCRTLLGVLDQRGVKIFAVSEATRIPLAELRRVLEFGSIDRHTADRLVNLGHENGHRHQAKNPSARPKIPPATPAARIAELSPHERASMIAHSRESTPMHTREAASNAKQALRGKARRVRGHTDRTHPSHPRPRSQRCRPRSVQTVRQRSVR